MGVDDGNGEGDDFPSSSIIAKDGGGVHVMIWDLESDYWLILFGLCVFCWDEGEVVLFVFVFVFTRKVVLFLVSFLRSFL